MARVGVRGVKGGVKGRWGRFGRTGVDGLGEGWGVERGVEIGVEGGESSFRRVLSAIVRIRWEWSSVANLSFSAFNLV